MTRSMTDDRIAAMIRTVRSGKDRTAILAALQTECGLSDESARTALRISETTTSDGRRLYEAAEAFASAVNRAECKLTEASTNDLASAVAARFA